MLSKRALRVIVISFILFLSSSLPNILVTADSAGATTLYFHDYYIEEMTGELDQNKPTSDNDSVWPPKIRRDEFEWIIWFEFWLITKFGSLIEDEYLSDGGYEDLFPSPFELSDTYIYDGDEPIEINGSVTFDLFFSTTLDRKNRDEVKVTISKNDFIIFSDYEKNETITIEPARPRQINKYQITIEEVEFTLETGDTLTASVEIIPADKRLVTFVDRLEKWGFDGSRILNLVQTWANWANGSRNEKRRERGQTAKDIFELLDEFNITINISDVADIINVIRTSSFIYNSIDHPSSITLPIKVPGEDIRIYYLHDGNEMDENSPGNDLKESELSESPIKWTGSKLERSKILKNASADLYLNSLNLRFLKKITITASLFEGEDEITSSSVELPRDFFLFTKPSEPITFNFGSINEEIEYGNDISLGVAFSNGSKPGPLMKVKLLYDTEEYPSSLTLQFSETDHIKMDVEPIDAFIVPGNRVQFLLNITSDFNDEIEVKTLGLTEEEGENWDIEIDDGSFSISAQGSKTLNISVTSKDNSMDAYGEILDMKLSAEGKTGIAMTDVSVEISELAIDYDVNIVGYTESKNIKKGGSGIFYFVIENNNTGAIDDVDSYTITATSKNDWELEHTKSITDLIRGGKTGPEEILVHVSVPDNTTLESDTITFTVTSDSNNEAFATVNVTVTITGAGILESILEYLESLSESLGLDNIFGDYAPIVLLAIPILIILIIVLLLAFVLRRKFVTIICTDRILQIDPDDKAEYEITVQNPTRKTQIYELSFNSNPSTNKWLTSIEPDKVTVESKKSKTVVLTIKPTEVTEPKDWTETKVKVNREGKKRSAEISTMLMVKEGSAILQITKVFSWPKIFKSGDRILTSFRVENKGSISARNAKIILYINGGQKNKVEVTIPSRGFADIKMPWIAVRGKNKLLIKTVE